MRNERKYSHNTSLEAVCRAFWIILIPGGNVNSREEETFFCSDTWRVNFEDVVGRRSQR